MTSFGALPFEEQLARIAALASEDDPRPLLREAGALPDAEPFARMLEALEGRLDELEEEVAAAIDSLSDAALQHVLARESTPRVAALLVRRVEHALSRWPLSRLMALAFAARWLRRRSPEAYARVAACAARALTGPPAAGSARWLLFASGRELEARAADPAWAALTTQTVRDAIDTLARAPKSISQANAERLLAQRVYADPGHFFFELLQNADDAGAARWSADIGRERVSVRHDGAPFSLLDLVGVLSIGQTTKHSAQIGFFGVGFKSVYEICERPRVRSGVFAFEIAHVSIPRALASAPEGSSETVLVLPYVAGVDAAVLATRARAIPPETLMTLPRLASIAVRGPDGSESRWHEEREDAAGGALVTLKGEEVRRYRCVTRELAFEGPREEGRARESAVRVAAPIDERGAPRALEGPTLYAFLPTAERTGLRVLVHARFDVTLDRERLELGSVWNDALLAEAGRALGALVEALAREGKDALPILSAPSELAPSMAPLTRALAAALDDVPFMKGVRGERLAPSEARLLSTPLAAALAGEDLGGDTFALAPLGDRERAVAAGLGVRAFDAIDLVRFAAERLSAGAPPPAWLGEAVLEALAVAPVDDAALCALPLLPDGAGTLAAAEHARLASAAWARLYAGERPVVSHEALAVLPAALRARLALVELDRGELARDLEDAPRRARLLLREDALFQAIAELEELEPLAALPLIAVLGSEARSPAREVWRLESVLAPLMAILSRRDLAQRRRDAEVARVALIDPALSARHPALFARWLPSFGVGELVGLLEAGLVLEDGELAVLLEVLDALAPSLPRALLRRLGALPIVLDRQGARRPLVGPRRALLACDAALERALPEWPWIARRPLVDAIDPAPVDARAIALALSGDGEPIGVERLEAVEAWLRAHAGELPRALVDRLAGAPIWLDTEGRPRPLDELRRGTRGEALDALYAVLGMRGVASDGALRLAGALGLDARVPASDHAALVADLARVEIDGAPRPLLTAALEEAALRLRPDELAPLATVPLFLDESGTPRALGSWRAPEASRAHRPGAHRAVLRSGPWPLLSDEDERALPSLLAALAPIATPSDVVRHAIALLGDPSALTAFLDVHAESLDPELRALLAGLPIFRSGAGELHVASALALRAPLLDALGAARVAPLAIEDALFAPEAESLAVRLGLEPRPTRALVEARLALIEGAPLDEQPAPWRTRGDLIALATLAARVELALPLAIDAAERLVRGPVLAPTDAARRLASALPLAARLGDREWAEAMRGHPLERALLAPLAPRQLCEALRERFVEESPRDALDTDALFAWLGESAEAIAADEAAKGALGAAAVLPSQRGTLRAPRDLVLDPALPDVGLAWGLAPEVPPALARWLADTFEIDRRARRALVAHVLDGIDEAAARDDRARAASLIAFLARALGAGELDRAAMDTAAHGTRALPQNHLARGAPSGAVPGSPNTGDGERSLDGETAPLGRAREGARQLEERARRLDVRARLKVPVAGGWAKPRFAWAATDAVAREAERFARDLPPRIALDDGPSLRLMVACGAAHDLDDARVIACLEGAIDPTPAARRVLARYVALRALADPSCVERWRLASRAWVPASDGTLHRPASLIWPDELAHALFGEGASSLPDPEVVAELDADRAAPRLGFARASTLTLSEAARHLGHAREGHTALLEWLERGLGDGRFGAQELRRLMQPLLLLRDEEGLLRPVRELARSGARELFGSRRGDWAGAHAHPRLARALGIPARPDAPMIVAFLVELGVALEALDGHERDRLALHLEGCLEALPADARLPAGAAIAGVCDGRVVLARLGDPALCMLAPPELADALEPRVLAGFIDPLPTDREPRLESLLLASGVPDLMSVLAIDSVVPGLARPALDEDAEALRARLAPLLPAIGKRARAYETLAVSGTIAGAEVLAPVLVSVDAAVLDGTLSVTERALREPALLAPALAPDPARRAALRAWLESDAASPPPRVPARAEAERPARVTAEAPRPEGLFARVKRFFTSDEEREARAPEPAPSAAPKERSDERHFRPRKEIEPQLEGSEGWLDARKEAPAFGFAFTPSRLEPPWLYAPKEIGVRFDRRDQTFRPAPLRRPEARGEAGLLALRGRLPAGDAVLPLPLYGRVLELSAEGAELRADGTALRLDAEADVRVKIALGHAPALDDARPAQEPAALERFVPDAELPEEVHDLLAELDGAAIERALAVRDFVRERYRYDPSYLEDPAVGRWLARVTRGRANAHVAALHAGADGRHLGAGVCYELNTLACELLRRAGIPAAITTGWVLDRGHVSEPDHLWALALLEDASGPVWVPIDASTTREGRPLRVPHRPPTRFRAPRADSARAPRAPRWEATKPQPKPKKKRPPRAELLRVLRHLEKLAGRPLDEPERAQLERALTDPSAAKSLLERLRR